MRFEDLFAPYSPKRKGELRDYLLHCEENGIANHFYGPKYYFAIQKSGLMIPQSTWVRVSKSPAPDIGYIVNAEYLLESGGAGRQNMSLVGAKAGISTPEQALKSAHWSIHNLRLWDEME
jgi:hypothetical protein